MFSGIIGYDWLRRTKRKEKGAFRFVPDNGLIGKVPSNPITDKNTIAKSGNFTYRKS